MKELFADLETFCRLCGGSGFEEEIATAVFERYQSAGVKSHIDNLGNVIGHIPGGGDGLSVLIAAHMDEVGLVVQYVEENGFLRFDTNGLVDPAVLPSTRVRLMTNQGPRMGVVGARPSHLVTEEDRRRPIQVSDLWIDLGVESSSQVAGLGVRIGDPVTFYPHFEKTAEGFVISKAIDDRAGLAILMEILRRRAKTSLPFDLYLAATVQEEIGSRGARTAAQAINPTIALVIDTMPVADPLLHLSQTTAQIGHGPVLRALDYRSNAEGTVHSRKLRNFMIDVAESKGLPYQIDIFRTWTDASTMHLTGHGIATQGIFLPRRYSHSPAEVCHLKDIEAMAEIVWNSLAALDCERLRDLQKRF